MLPNQSAQSIIISEGHNVTIGRNAAIKNTTIQNNAELQLASGSIVLMTNNQLVIESGGVLNFKGSRAPIIEEDASIIVQAGGAIKVTTNVSGISSALAANGSINRVFFLKQMLFLSGTTRVVFKPRGKYIFQTI